MGITGFTGLFTLDDRDDFDLSIYDLNSLYCTNRLRVFWCIPCTVLYCTVLYCVVLHCTILYDTVRCGYGSEPWLSVIVMMSCEAVIIGVI